MIDQQRVIIDAVDFEGKGVTRIEGKTVFVEGALSGEEALIEIIKRKTNFDRAKLVKIIKPSPDRTYPECPNFGICGGCSTQHISFEAQVKIKEQALIDNLKHIGKASTDQILPPLMGKPWGYRHRARLSAKYVAKKGGVLVGFRERGAPYVADMQECKILPKHVSDLIPALRELIAGLSIKDKIPQIEAAVGIGLTVLVIRNMKNLSAADEELVYRFVDKYKSNEHQLQMWLQPKGPETCYPFYPLNLPKLSYDLVKFDIKMPYYPGEFTQVNPYINQEMVNLAISLLDPQQDEVIADFFCGIGNFTLPIAKYAKLTIGIEGSDQLVKRANENAIYNNLAHKAAYQAVNLFKIDSNWLQKLGYFDKWLIDPSRDGAFELVKAITPQTAPQRIIYVSCNPATLARDAGELVNVHGYRLVSIGVINMFPHTSHIESIARFELA